VSVLALQGDARRLPLADESVHLVVTSPPYNARVRYDGYEDWLPWEEYWEGLLGQSLRECYRVLVHGGRIAVNLANVLRQDIGTPGGVRNGKWYSYGGRGRKRGAPIVTIIAPLMWQVLSDIGFLPREHLTWIKAPAPEEAVVCSDSTAWGSWRSASNPVLRAVAIRSEPGRVHGVDSECLVHYDGPR
jgi:DNA modification methylase